MARLSPLPLMDRRLVAGLLTGLVLLVGETVRQQSHRAQMHRVGVSTRGDTVWLDAGRTGEYWSFRVDGRTVHGEWLTGWINCAKHEVQYSDIRAITELAPQIADTACGLLRRTE